MTRAPFDRFVPKVNFRSDGCWEWAGARDRDGYGQFRGEGRQVKAHRWSYEFFVAPIPSGLPVDHLCKFRPCVNPDHLEPVTTAENIRRGETGAVAASRNRAKTHCPRGHEYSGANLYVQPKRGGRVCRTCTRTRMARRS